MFSRSIIRLTLALIIVAASLLLVTSITATAAAPTTDTRPRADLIVNPGESIQAAIDAANDGDTIIINAGDYTESLTLSKPVSLTGVNSDTTIIHAVAGQRVLTVTGATIGNSVVISGLTFTGGDVSGGWQCPIYCGGGLALLNTAQPRISNVIIQHNQAAYGGGLIAAPGSPLQIENSRVISNSAGDGGGIYAGDWSQPGSLTAAQTIFSDNAASRGGGLYMIGEASLSDVQFEGNTATDLGGAINARNGTLDLTRAVFVRNTGSAMYSENSPANITDSYFEQNSGDIGGAVWMYYVGANISHTDFISNSAALGGGGVTMVHGSIVNSRFEGNTSQTQWGGGVYAMGQTLVTNTQFISNAARTHGGGAYFGDVELYDSRFERNTSIEGGGGFFAFVTLISNTDVISNQAGCNSWGCGGGGAFAFNEATVTNSRFENNVTVGGSGGGLNANGAITLTHSTFISNTANSNGGGLYASEAVTLTNVEFISNTAHEHGGGLYVDGITGLTNTRFISNTAVQGGGAYFTGTLNLVNGLFVNNLAHDGSALVLLRTNGSIRHTTIAATEYNSGTAVIIGTGLGSIVDSIITNFHTGIAGIKANYDADYNLFFNNDDDMLGIGAGTHNVIGDPRFVDPAHDDYHLAFGSAAIDHGMDAGVYTDLDGHARPIGPGFDIGAYEYQLVNYIYLPLIQK